MTQTTESRHVEKGLRYALIVLGAALAALVAVLVLQYGSFRRAREAASARAAWLSAFTERHGPLTAGDVALLRPWMTFDYVNVAFKLPPDYLKSKLGISDARYPQLSIGGYARSARLEPAAFLESVAGAVSGYLSAGTSTAE